MIIPIGKNIMVEIEEIKEVSGIVLPDSTTNIHETAEVLAVGPEVDSIKPPDRIYFKSWALDTIIRNPNTQQEEKVSFIKEKDVLAYDDNE